MLEIFGTDRIPLLHKLSDRLSLVGNGLQHHGVCDLTSVGLQKKFCAFASS